MELGGHLRGAVSVNQLHGQGHAQRHGSWAWPHSHHHGRAVRSHDRSFGLIGGYCARGGKFEIAGLDMPKNLPVNRQSHVVGIANARIGLTGGH